MSIREDILELGSSATATFDSLVSNGIDEELAAEKVVLLEYKNILEESINLHKELSLSTDEVSKELSKIDGLIEENK